MSREIKVCDVNTLNDVNDRVRALQRSVLIDIADAQREALRTANYEAQRRIDAARQEMIDKMNRNTSYINSRLQSLDESQRRAMRSLADQVYGRISELNRSMTTRMDKQFDTIRQGMQSMDRSIRADMGRMQSDIYDYIKKTQQWTKENLEILNENIVQLGHEVDKRFEQQQAEIDNVRKDIGILFDEIKKRQNAKSEAILMAKELLQKINGRIDLSRFAPERWHEINIRVSSLDTVSDDSACIAQAHEICIQAMLAEEEAWKNKLKIDSLAQLASAELKKVLEVVNANREIKASHPDYPEETVNLEADFWTRGQYQKIIEELECIKRTVDNPYDKDITPEILGGYIKRIAELESISTDLIQKSVERAILSENRVVVTEDIVTALIEQGYEVAIENGKEAINYMGGEQENDWREGVYAILEKGTGEKITIIVKPNEDATKNQLIFHRNDNRNITDAEYIASLERIKKEIQRSGHPVGDLQAPADGGNTQIPELRSSESLSKKGAASIIEEQIVTHNKK